MDWLAYPIQLEWIRHLQALGGPFVDALMGYAHYLDSQAIYVLVISSMWVWCKPQVALLPTLAMAANVAVNHTLKHLLGQPRPFVLDSGVALAPLLDPTLVNGLPSGGAQTAMLMAGLLVFHCRRPWAFAFALVYPLFVGLSRIYLGVHFLQMWRLGM